jgi:D-sedoheptulose 7-phosphate isomerase
MQTDLYKNSFNDFFNSPIIQKSLEDALPVFKSVKRIFFLGNGGSNSICSHMMEDYGKIARFRTYAFSDSSLITCYANDYGFENSMMEWLKLHFDSGDLLVAVSSSGESKNIINAAAYALEANGKLITLTGFAENNTLSRMGEINFHLPIKNYGIVESFHQVILHVILDTLVV